MLVDLDKVKKILQDDSLSGAKLEKLTGIHRATIIKYRKADSLDTMQLKVAIRLQQAYDHLKEEYGKKAKEM